MIEVKYLKHLMNIYRKSIFCCLIFSYFFFCTFFPAQQKKINIVEIPKHDPSYCPWRLRTFWNKAGLIFNASAAIGTVGFIVGVSLATNKWVKKVPEMRNEYYISGLFPIVLGASALCFKICSLFNDQYHFIEKEMRENSRFVLWKIVDPCHEFTAKDLWGFFKKIEYSGPYAVERFQEIIKSYHSFLQDPLQDKDIGIQTERASSPGCVRLYNKAEELLSYGKSLELYFEKTLKSLHKGVPLYEKKHELTSLLEFIKTGI